MKRYISSAIQDPRSEDPSTRIMIASDPRTDPAVRRQIWSDLANAGYYTHILFHYYYTCDHEVDYSDDYDEIEYICGRVEIAVEQILHIYHYYTQDSSYADDLGYKINASGEYVYELIYEVNVDDLIYDDNDINSIKAAIVAQLHNLGCEVDESGMKFYIDEPEPLF